MIRGEFQIKVGDKTRGFKFSTYSLAKACELEGDCTLDVLFERCGWGEGKTVNLKTLLNLFYAAAYTYSKSKREEIDYNDVDVSDWLDEIGHEETSRIIKKALNTPEQEKKVTTPKKGSSK